MFKRLLLVSFSLKFCDHVEMLSSWVLAGIARITFNKHVVREGGSRAATLETLPQNKPASLILTDPKLLVHIVQHCMRQAHRMEKWIYNSKR